MMTAAPPQSLISAATLRWLIDRNVELERRVTELEARLSPPPEQETAPPDLSPEDLIELPEAAARFGMSKNALEKLCRRGLIGEKPQGRWLISPSRLKAHLDR
jgi:hypothetical protein